MKLSYQESKKKLMKMGMRTERWMATIWREKHYSRSGKKEDGKSQTPILTTYTAQSAM